MPSWITYDHRCERCGATHAVLHDRTDVKEVVACEDCGGDARKFISSNITQASYVDGSGRLNHIREQRKIEREYKKAQRQGRRDDTKKLRVELGKQKSTH